MRYRVVGNNEVLGYDHGEEFEMILDPVTETRLVAGGHIERVGDFEYTVPDEREEPEEGDDAYDEARWDDNGGANHPDED